MNRSLLALAALAGIGLGVARADYLIIKVNMGVAPAEVVRPQPGQPGGLTGFPGRPGVPPVVGQPGAPGTKQPASNALTVVIPFEYSKMAIVPPQQAGNLPPGAGVALFEHKYGRSYVYTDNKWIQITPTKDNQVGQSIAVPIKRPTVLQSYEKKKGELVLIKDKSAAKQLEVAKYALEHGLLKQCTEVMEEVSKLETKEPAVIAAVKAFEKVRKDLAAPIGRDEPSIVWKDELRYKSDRTEHFTLLYDTTGQVEIKARLARMERNMEAFYYWFALQGKALPVPGYRMVSVMAEKPADWEMLNKVYGWPEPVADGIFARRDNLVVLSSNRLDTASAPLARHFTELIQQGWDLKMIMHPKPGMFKPPPGKPTGGLAEIAQIATMALVKRVLEEESEIATTSHQGSRQLLTAIGLLPRGVEIPNWIQFGWPAFFETPKFDPVTQTAAFWPGTGAPSWTYLVQWKLWDLDRQLEDPIEGLMGVLTDRFFLEAKRTNNPEMLHKARTYAWSLAFYLSQRELDGLLRYGEELSQLPRDLEFDGPVLLGCFARAFKCADATKANGVDEAKLEALAKDWYKFIGIEQMQMPELFVEAQKVYREKKAQPKP
jgi:hypothetical protein